ncbi:amino acid adenylation domain-containing protein [Pseudomonas alkylphenolica]|uniref:non-ribosomal peptide synthetase n=1 Tax=Pseudomonas alkylphenolica TaxID=237609 RepID=UPI00315D6259
MDNPEKLATALTTQQNAQWLMARMHPEDTRYNIGLGLLIKGELDRDALRFALQRLVAGNEILRTTYGEDQGRAVAICNLSLEVPLSVIDGQGLDDETIKVRIQSWLNSPFDLLHGPCLRLGCFVRGRQEHILVVCAHHIIADFTSLGLLLEQLESLYLDEIGSGAEHWRDTPVSFAAYRRQVCDSDSAEVRSSQAYWHRYLDQLPAPLNWPDHWRQGVTAAASHYLSLDGERLQRLRQLAGETGASLYAVILGTWAVAVSGACAQADVVVGMPVSMRDSNFAHTLGSLFNVLPLRVRVTGSLRELLRTIRKDLHEALDHRQFDLADTLETLAVPRPEGRNPLFQTTVNLLGEVGHSRWLTLQMATPQVHVQWAGLHAAPWPLEQQQGQVDIALEFVDAQDSLRCVIKADLRCFSTTGLERFAVHWLNIVDALLDERALPGGTSHAKPGDDYNQVPQALNAVPTLATRMPSLVAWFDSHAARYPDAVAVQDSVCVLNYRSLQDRSVQLARYLLELGATPGERIGLLLAPGVNAVVAMLAIMRAGAAYVPLDPALPAERLDHIVHQSAINLVVGDVRSPWGTDRDARFCNIDALCTGGAQLSESVFNLSGPDTCAYSVFTSGSTGEPKGIDVAQRNVVALLESMYAALQIPERLVWSWSHAASFDLSVWEIWGALCTAGSLIVVPQDIRSRPDRLMALLSHHQVNVITQTPSGLRQLQGDFLKHPPLLAARHWVICGEALPGATARHYLSDRWDLWNLYGPAETTVFASIERVTPALAEEAVVPIGRPLAFASIQLRMGEGCPALGAVGEIVIGGAGVSLGYVGLDQHTRERFIADPGRAGATSYRTGDLASWDGERLRFAGRVDEQVKLNGYRIELAEIERCLELAVQVHQAAALLEEVGGQPRLVALVQWGDEQAAFDEKALREHLRRRLPAYMLPTRLLAVPSLPLNRHAKLDRKAARRLLEALGPVAGPALALGDSWRERVKAIWAEVLGRTQVGLDDTFFDLGGNSMTLLQVHARLQQWPEGQHLRPSDLFRLITPRMLSDALQEGSVCGSTREVQDPRRRRERVLRRRQCNESSLAQGGDHE